MDKLLKRRIELLAEMRAADEAGNQEDFDRLSKEIDDLDVEIRNAEERAKRMATATQAGADLEERASRPVREPVADTQTEERVTTVEGGDHRANFETLAHQMREVRYRQVTGSVLRGGVYESRANATGLSLKIEQDGSVLVDPAFSNEIMPVILDDAGLVARCAHRPLQGNQMKIKQIKSYDKSGGSRTGVCTAYWPDEAEAITDSKPQFETITLDLRKVAAMYYATDEILDDAAFMTAELNAGVGEELRLAIENELFNGNGTSRPQGALNSAALVTQEIEDGQLLSTGAIKFENMIKMWSRVPQRFRNNAVILYNPELEPWFAQMTLIGGTATYPVFMPPGGVSEKPYYTFYGRPMIPFFGCAAPGTTGDIAIVDFSQYLLGMKTGMPLKSAASIHVKFAEEETAFRFSMRVDGLIRQTAVYTPENGSSGFTQSGVVMLGTRAG